MKELNDVLDYMKQYVNDKYEHDSEPMLNWKDIKLALDEIERLRNIINELEKWLKDSKNPKIDYNYVSKCKYIYVDYLLDKIQELVVET